MSHPLQSLTSLPEIDGIIARSQSETVAIFKHSPTCGTSAMAEEEVLGFLDSSDCAMPVWCVDVWAERAVSQAVAERLGVRHESPQILLIRDGRVVWSASHFRVTAETIARKVHDLAQPAPAR